MFDEHQKGREPLNYIPAVITLASGCAGVMVSLGLCSIGLVSRSANMGFVGSLGFFVFGVSMLAVLVSVPWLIVVAIMNAVRR